MQTGPDTVHPTQTRLLHDVRDGGNTRAWAEFHRIYAPLVTGFCRRMGLIDADADDATQEIMLIAHAALREGTYDRSKGRFRGWLYGVARNKALEANRSRRRPSRAQAIDRVDGLDLLSGLEDRGQDTERAIWDQEWRYAILAEAMRQVQVTLGDKVFSAFVQYGVERRPVEDVARGLGITSSSVYVYKQRALVAIREWVDRFAREGD